MNNRNIIKNLSIVLVLGLILSFAYILKTSWSTPDEDFFFEIKRGSSVMGIVENLEKEGIINSRYPFLGYLLLTGKSNNLQAGTYKIESGISIIDLADKFKSGDVSKKRVTIVEGLNLREIATILEREDLIERERFFAVTGLSEPQASLEGIEQPTRKELDIGILNSLETDSLEGYLFPDTYEFTSESEKEIVQIMIFNLKKRLEGSNLLEKAEERGLDVHELITMASLIEKEVPDFEDMQMVSDILWRRIDAGMPLQVDATVNYVTGRRGIDVTINETEIPSSFNTYQKTGLPEGPISAPSLNSLRAALMPKDNDYWYYLSDPESGKTVFSKNHLEHVQAKNKYLR